MSNEWKVKNVTLSLVCPGLAEGKGDRHLFMSWFDKLTMTLIADRFPLSTHHFSLVTFHYYTTHESAA